MTLTAERVRALLDYDAATGQFTWLADRTGKAKVGQRAGTLQGNGAVAIGIDGKVYLAHRLAWLWTHGSWPRSGVDHINGNRSDNRLDNLRVATPKQNSGNRCLDKRNKSGYRGVSWHQGKQMWLAQVTVAGRAKSLGLYETAEEASEACQKAGIEEYGEFYQTRQNSHDIPDAKGMITVPVRLHASQEAFLWGYSKRFYLGGRLAAIRHLITAAMNEANHADDKVIQLEDKQMSTNVTMRVDDELREAITKLRLASSPIATTTAAIRRAILMASATTSSRP